MGSRPLKRWWLSLVLGWPAAVVASESGAPPPPRLDEIIAQRRSVRSYQNRPVAQDLVLKLCWSAQGITDAARGQRAAPSAGATYPLELYVVTAAGVSRYVPRHNELVPHHPRDVRRALRRAALDQEPVETAPVVFVFAADARRTEARYGARAERYVWMEAGHAAQNLLLQAVALGLGSVPIGAFDDAPATQAMKLPEGQRVVYLLPVGWPE